jgi:hypothetical protein
VYRFACPGFGQELILQVWRDKGLEIASPVDDPVVPIPPKLIILPLPNSRQRRLCAQCEDGQGES